MSTEAKVNPTRPKRRNYYIDKKFQTQFMVKFCLIIFIGGLLSVGLTMLVSQDTLTTNYNGSKLVIEQTSMAIMPSVITATIVTTVVISIIAIGVMIFVSHKIAGPIYRFENDLKVVAEGDLNKKFRLREGDQFSVVVSSLNDMVGSLNEKVSEVYDDLDKLSVQAKEENLPEPFIQQLIECREKINERFKI